MDYADVFPAMISGLSGADGKLYAAPFYGESCMLYYRKDLFQAAGLTMPEKPKWDDIAGFAAKLHNKQNGPYGIALRALPGWGEFGAPLTATMNAFGGRWFDEQWKSQLASPKSAAGIKFYTDLLINSGQPSATTSGFTECENLFVQGKTAMWMDATSAADLLGDPKANPQAANTGFACPRAEAGNRHSGWLWAWAFAIEKTTKHAGRRARVREVGDLERTTSTSSPANSGGVRCPRASATSTYADAGYKDYAKRPSRISCSPSSRSRTPTKCCVDPVPYKGLQFVGVPEFVTLGNERDEGTGERDRGQREDRRRDQEGRRHGQPVGQGQRLPVVA